MGIQLFDKADLWKSLLLLKVQLRDRFRIAVDDHRGRAAVLYTDGYFSSSIHRLAARFRNFRRESLPSAPAFYRRRVPKDLTAEEESAIFRMLQAVAVPLIGNACHVFMNGLNRVQVYGLEKLHDALLNRPKNKPLVTVSNHVASLDDPFVIASLLPPKLLLDARNLRWTLCATDRCFKNPVTSAFFRSVKVLPVSRGEGIYQQGMDIAISKLNNGGWVHIFPEGSRSRDGGKTMGSAKRGIGRLILDADTLPMVVPFVHTGMQDIMPIGASVPRIGKTVSIFKLQSLHNHDLLNQQGYFTEPPAPTAAGHPCPYVTYIGPVHSSSSSSAGVTGVSDSPSFTSHWNTGSSGEVPTPYGFPHYHGWEYHSSPPTPPQHFSPSGPHVGSPTHPTPPPASARTSRANGSDVIRPRMPQFMRPSYHAHSSSGRAGSSVASVPRTPPFPGSNVRTRDRTQALQAYYQQSTAQQHQPDSPIVSRGPVFPSGRRPSRESASSSSDQVGGGSGFLRFNIWEREPYMQPQQAYQVNQMDAREPSIWASSFNEGGGSFHQRHGGGGPS
ncbi:hypothetical protein F2Q70_00009634 [Brassica cretica]|uniref:Phospholipid/glycerol acyltransferase domain-containing protein n=1 Tax=Brassica cretica TaxID=69181 RepID=A0A8S9LVT5_BRACR|nr:hypothetical protein F2Q70_00009634 [Brassica cretica]